MKKIFVLLNALFLIPIAVFSREKPKIAHEFDYTGIKNVEIRGAMYYVKVEGKDISTVTGKIETNNKNYLLNRKQEGDTLVLWFEKPHWGIFSISTRNTLTMQVPVAANITIDNSSGRVEVKNIQAENVHLKTSSGSIAAENIKGNQSFRSSSGTIALSKAYSSDQISLHASSGDIKIAGLTADLKVHCTSGKITIDEAQGEKILNTSSGDINVSLSNGNIKSNSSSGKHTYKDISGNIKASTSSGDIIIKGYRGSLDLRTTSGSIKGENINIISDSSFITSSGTTSIDYRNAYEDFTFDLSASSGTLQAGSTTAYKKLHTGNGPIRIKGVSSSGSQYYR